MEGAFDGDDLPLAGHATSGDPVNAALGTVRKLPEATLFVGRNAATTIPDLRRRLNSLRGRINRS